MTKDEAKEVIKQCFPVYHMTIEHSVEGTEYRINCEIVFPKGWYNFLTVACTNGILCVESRYESKTSIDLKEALLDLKFPHGTGTPISLNMVNGVN